MHPQVRGWLRRALKRLDGPPTHVIEVGSRHLRPRAPLDDPRSMVEGASYIGLDAHPGRGVDVVSTCAEYAPRKPADLVLLFQTLEHDPTWRETVLRAWSWVGPGGVLAITCAGKGCPEHDLGDSPEPGYYGNVTSAQVLEVLEPVAEGCWSEVQDTPMVMQLGTGPVSWTRTRVMVQRRP